VELLYKCLLIVEENFEYVSSRGLINSNNMNSSSYVNVEGCCNNFNTILIICFMCM